MRNQIIVYFATALLVSSTIPVVAAPAMRLPGFGNIPFGTPADKALALNNGNGIMQKDADGTSILVYRILIAGMQFRVTQHFTASDRASIAKVRYQSGEQPYPCIARFNYVLARLNQRYGKPSAPPSFRRDEVGSDTHDRYTVAFSFANKSALLASALTIYPTPVPQKSTGGKVAPAQAAGAPNAGASADQCEITLAYLPPRWSTNF